MLLLSIWCACIWSVESAVLDPSLYLSPRPPLTDIMVNGAPTTLWSRSKDITFVPDSSGSSLELADERSRHSIRKPNAMEKAKLFWPSLRPSHYSVGTGNIQIPLTFSLSGIYGKYAPGAGSAIIGSSYGTVSEIGGTAISTVAGSGYGSYPIYPGLRIYGRENGSAWSGWGNGKWGHYGKG